MPIFKAPKQEDHSEILEALREARFALDMARIAFENAVEPELVDASVYEMSALEARYNYLLRLAREQGATAEAVFKDRRTYV